MLTKLGLVTDDNPAPTPVAVPPPAAPQPDHFSGLADFGHTPFTPSAAQADPATVAQIKTMVLGASPIVAQFVQYVELARGQFGNDNVSCIKAALAFARTDKTALAGELNRAVVAALIHAKQKSESDRQKAHDSAVSGLDTDISATKASINDMQSQVLALQQSINEKQANLNLIQGKIQDVETNLKQQDDGIKAAFAEVEQYITQLKQIFTT